MAARKVNFTSLRHKLMATQDGIETHRLFARLLREASYHSEDVLSILAEYTTSGPLNHCREHAMAQLAKIVPVGASTFRSLFEQGLADPHTAYWSLQGLIRVADVGSYPKIVDFALKSSHTTEARGKAIKELAMDAGQHFIRKLPSDPGKWREEQLPLAELKRWAAAGFPKGPGFPPPPRHQALDTPESAIDFAASRLESKLAKSRRERQDIANPTDWLTPASPADLDSVQCSWPLPTVYLEFLRKFSPLRVTIENRRYYQGLSLYGASELISGQQGYSLDPLTGANLPEWPSDFVVIADHALDPLVLDLTRKLSIDAPILTAMHGTGEWIFRKEAPSFLVFLERLAR